MRPRGDNTTLWSLKRNGPLPMPELPTNPGVKERSMYDIRSFDPLGHSSLTCVWYLNEYHSRDLVLDVYLVYNWEAIENRGYSERKFKQALNGSGFEEAWERRRHPLDEHPFERVHRTGYNQPERNELLDCRSAMRDRSRSSRIISQTVTGHE